MFESACCRWFSIFNPAPVPRVWVPPSMSAPASVVLLSMPSVPAASRKIFFCPARVFAAASARCWLRPPLPELGGRVIVVSPP